VALVLFCLGGTTGGAVMVRPSGAYASPGVGCVPAVEANLPDVPWPQLRLAPDRAWASARGAGISIGIVGSGVEAASPALAGRVAAGADIMTGKGFANGDCLGVGTAMAGVAVAQPRPGSGLVGFAPDATVLPLRIVAEGRDRAGQLAVALQVAVSAGVAVIAVSGFVDLGDPNVDAAVRATVARGVVVVVAADQVIGGQRVPGVLRVGAVDAGNHLVGSYRAGGVDVVAPGASIITLGANGSGEVMQNGSHLAVAFVAAVVALVRSAAGGLPADRAAEQVITTADQIGAARPDPQTGWGMIDPVQAVQVDPAPITEAAAPSAADGSSRTFWGIGLIVLALVIAVLAAWQWRASRASGGKPAES